MIRNTCFLLNDMETLCFTSISCNTSSNVLKAYHTEKVHFYFSGQYMYQTNRLWVVCGRAI